MAIGNNLISLFVVIKLGKSYYNQSNIVNGVAQLAAPPPPAYLSIVQAQADGAVTWNYGQFFQVCINFIIVALILFSTLLSYSFHSLLTLLFAQCW
jgi:large-conductance mechanosensitive channel